MIGEFNLYGVYLPWLLVMAVMALAIGWAVRKVLAACGVYQVVWHPALFDLALFILILYGLNLALPMLLN
ncbi:MAG: DUF1656 domain-containing protein [Comamonadaceae bacterium]|nr:MAG: DUF1656 domain-containing protein [Comamonadaceae bacterium]